MGMWRNSVTIGRVAKTGKWIAVGEAKPGGFREMKNAIRQRKIDNDGIVIVDGKSVVCDAFQVFAKDGQTGVQIDLAKAAAKAEAKAKIKKDD